MIKESVYVPETEPSSLSTGAIIGIVIGCVVAVVIAITVSVALILKKKKQLSSVSISG